jgi:Na+/glutamate symporter
LVALKVLSLLPMDRFLMNMWASIETINASLHCYFRFNPCHNVSHLIIEYYVIFTRWFTALKPQLIFCFFTSSRYSAQIARWTKLFQIMILYSAMAHVIVRFTRDVLILLWILKTVSSDLFLSLKLFDL